MENTPQKETFLIDFLITENCNYRCPYCSQSKKFVKHPFQDADNDVISALLNFMDKNDFNYEVTISGGEPLTHPEFFLVVEEIVKRGGKISVFSNFSFPVEKYLKLKEIAQDNLKELFVSLHLSQIKSPDEFLRKAETFNNYKGKTKFATGAVLTDENCGTLKFVSSALKEKNIDFELQHMRIKNSYIEYGSEAKEFISTFPVCGIKEKSDTFSKVCLAGCRFMFIYPNGEVYRCYSSRFNRVHYLGNIKNPNFKAYKKPLPCLNKNCTCPKPVASGLVDFTRSMPFAAGFLSLYNLIWLPYYLVKNFDIVKTKFIQASKFKK